ncbi:MAG: dockerin type I repeat-containing protein [Clostridia bacterium]|nr:dockerin type I repeat-containing protein [Clostridia bacterium]
MKKVISRFWTGLMAVLTVISMMAIEVFAAGIDDLPNVTEYAENADSAGYLIETLDDLAYVAANKTSFRTGKTLYLTNDLNVPAAAEDTENKYQSIHDMSGLLASIDGQGHTISGLSLTASWLGNYATTGFIKNLIFSNCHITQAGWNTGLLISQYAKTDLTFENITMIGCSASKGSSNGLGLLIGQVSGTNAKVTLKNIRIENCVLNRDTADNSAFLVGTFGTWNNPTETFDVDGIYMINNEITGTANGQKTGRGILFGEVTGTGSIKNVAVYNTAVSKDADATVTNSLGIVVGGTKNNVSTLTVENVMAYNNGENFTRIVHATAGNAKISVQKVYSDATHLVTGSVTNVTNDAPYTEAQFKSGKAAYDANAAIVETSLRTWEMAVNATYPTLGTGLPVAVIFQSENYSKTLYTNTSGTLIGLDDELLNAAVWEKTVTAETVFTADEIINEKIIEDLPGDADGDGALTTADATLLLQHLVGKLELEVADADVNGDGIITIYDAVLLLQMLA